MKYFFCAYIVLGDWMKYIKQWCAVVFSVFAVFVYVNSDEELTVSSVYANNVHIYKVNEEGYVYEEDVDVVCFGSLNCILKTYEMMELDVDEVLLEEGLLVLRMNSSVMLTKEKEALYWYLLQFEDVDRVKIFVNDELWDSGVYYDAKQVYSHSFVSYVKDLYMSMPVNMYEYRDGYKVLRTIRIPFESDVCDIVSWLLYVYGESDYDSCLMENNVLKVSLVGNLSDRNHIELLGDSLCLLDVEGVIILHDVVEVYRK